MGVLYFLLGYYNLALPSYQPQCTYKLYGKRLNVLAEEHGIELNHHDALSDARASAELFLRRS